MKFSIDNLEFSSGDKIELENGSLTILIGPNSAGKSTALREIQTCLQGNAGVQVVKSSSITKEGTKEDFEKWLFKNYPSRTNSAGSMVYSTKGQDTRSTN
jgi:ABC-type cobalamin/Fe3+-siderophores transport system ATPase subunit